MQSGLAVLVANVVVVWKLARLVSTSIVTARVAVLTASLCYPLIFWTLRGMEVGLMALVVNLGPAAGALGPGIRPIADSHVVWLMLLPLDPSRRHRAGRDHRGLRGWRWTRRTNAHGRRDRRQSVSPFFSGTRACAGGSMTPCSRTRTT
jgi:hypothetical protein